MKIPILSDYHDGEVGLLMTGRTTANGRAQKVAAMALAVFCSVGLGVVSTSPASAADESGASDVREALRDVLPEVLSGLTTAATSDEGDAAIVSSAGAATVIVPVDPADGIDLDLRNGGEVSVSLPFVARAADAEVVQPGVVAYDNANGSVTVPAVKADGSVQIATVIESSSAPTRYAYQFEIPDGARLQLLGTEGAIVTAADDSVLLHIAPPVARDSAGRSVPTTYEVDGTTLVQIVELDGDLAFPVVADPWLGTALISRATVTYPYSDRRKIR